MKIQRNSLLAKRTPIFNYSKIILPAFFVLFISIGAFSCQSGNSTNESQSSEKTEPAIPSTTIGKWKEDKSSSSTYIIYEEDNNFILRTLYPNSQASDDTIIKKVIGDKIRYDYKNGGYNGEYFMVNKKNELEFYNKSGKEFTKALPAK